MYTLPIALRSALKDPMRPVVDTAGALAHVRAEATPVVAVGDVVTGMFLDAGIVPAVMIIDFKTQRTQDLPELRAAVEKTGARVVPVVNPPAEITRDLWNAIVEALDDDEPVVLQVEGEEDLAVLPVLALAPDGFQVVYGQPGEGVVIVQVDDGSRAFARDFLKKME